MIKYKSLILVMFFLFTFTLSKVNASIREYSLIGKYIIIDPGHARH